MPDNIFRVYFFMLALPCFITFQAFGAQAASRCDIAAHICVVAHNERDAGQELRQMPQNFSSPDLEQAADLSEAGESEYVARMRNWLSTLPEDKQQVARKILSEAHGEMHALRKAIYDKKKELAGVRFDNQESLEKLPKLGMDLQKLRNTLRKKLEAINYRLLNEAGIRMDQLAGEGIWLQPLSRIPAGKQVNRSYEQYAIPVSMLSDWRLPVEFLD